MKSLAKKTNGKLFFYILLAFTLYLTWQLLKQYISLILVSFIIVTIFYPIHKRLTNWSKGKTYIATPLTILIVFLTIFIPLAIVFSASAAEVVKLTNDIRDYTLSGKLSLEDVTFRINNFISYFPAEGYQITTAELAGYIRDLAAPFGKSALGNALNVGNTAVNATANVIIFIMLLSAMFNYYEDIIKFIRKLSPLSDEIDDLYISRLSAMSKAMVRGSFVIAVVQGTLTALTLWMLGVDYALLWSLLGMIASLFPLGIGVVVIPISLILMLSGDLWQGFTLWLFYALVTSQVDNIIRPRLVPKEAALHPVLTLLSMFGGISLFGFLGVIFGPMLMIFIFTTLEVYVEHFRNKGNIFSEN